MKFMQMQHIFNAAKLYIHIHLPLILIAIACSFFNHIYVASYCSYLTRILSMYNLAVGISTQTLHNSLPQPSL